VTETIDRSTVAAVEGLLPALVDGLPAVLDEVTALLLGEWPDYAEFLVEQRESVARIGTAALSRIVNTAADSRLDGTWDGELEGDLSLLKEAGRAQWRAGKPLTSLLSAYRAGGRAGWRQIARSAMDQHLPGQAVARLAEGVFAFMEELASASTSGYLEAQSEAAVERELARVELAELLLSDRADDRVVAATAERARWHVPATVAVVLVGHDDPVASDLLPHLDPASLPVHRPDAVGVLVPDPVGPGHRARLADALRGSGAVVGPSVAPLQLPAALRVTQVAMRLQREYVLTDDPVFVDEHLDAVIVHRDDALLETLQAGVLSPLAGLPSPNRERLQETLACWLWQMGDRRRVAAELHVHPQTVRYRLARLRELFGDALDDPAARGRLLLALGWSPAHKA
jgi:hypothetical protein